jgi:hypothetical protein
VRKIGVTARDSVPIASGKELARGHAFRRDAADPEHIGSRLFDAKRGNEVYVSQDYVQITGVSEEAVLAKISSPAELSYRPSGRWDARVVLEELEGVLRSRGR